MKISNVHPETHLLIYVNQTGRRGDDTMEAMKTLIKCPIFMFLKLNLYQQIKTFCGGKNCIIRLKTDKLRMK